MFGLISLLALPSANAQLPASDQDVRVYEVRGDNRPIGRVVVPNVDAPRKFEAGTEYWLMEEEPFIEFETFGVLVFHVITDGNWGDANVRDAMYWRPESPVRFTVGGGEWESTETPDTWGAWYQGDQAALQITVAEDEAGMAWYLPAANPVLEAVDGLIVLRRRATFPSRLHAERIDRDIVLPLPSMTLPVIIGAPPVPDVLRLP